jgi:ribosomal protein S18 acetylase RimI-like enzyme
VSIHIREMATSDYEAAFALWERTEGIGLSQADSKPNIQSFLAHNPGMSFVAEDEGRLVGAVLCGHDGRRGFLYHLAVAPGSRRGGVGRKLVDGSLAKLAELGFRKCHIFVMADNQEGKRFWSRTGWQERFDLVVMSRSVGG